MAEVLLLEKCGGLNNVVDPVRLDYDPKTGVGQLSMSVNVDIDDTGRISRRKGYTQARAEACHSVWAGKWGDAFYVAGTSLYRIGSDFSRVGVRSGLIPDLRMSFCQPAGAEVYYTNGIDCGKIVGNTSYSWIGDAYSGPTLMWKVDVSPPAGRFLDAIGGHLLIAQDDVLWYSMPFSYSWYVLSRDRVQFESSILMVKALNSGVWIGTEDGVYWLNGPDPGKWERKDAVGTPAIEGTGVVTDGYFVNKGIPGKVVIWSGEDGIFAGNEGGQIVNLTGDSLKLWKATRGSGIVYNGRYICILE